MATDTEEWVKAADGVEIYERVWQPDPAVPLVATVLFIHGIGEHIGRYPHVFSLFTAAGIRVRAFDQRGFGQTGRKTGILGHNDGYDTVLKDAKACSDRVRVPGVPHYVYGHSMGGGIVLRYALTYPNELDGVISSSPLIKPGTTTAVPAPRYWAIRMLASVVGTLSIENTIDASLLTTDPEVNKAYLEDPLNHGFVSIGTARDIFLNGEKIFDKDHVGLTMPILITFGTDDLICSCDAATQIIEKIPSADKTLKIFDGFKHEPHNEPQKDEYIKYLVDWILARAKKAPSS
ncbi:hypothetical protein HK104_006265 [Borealophlyctis nickersoniae]|nr:hypothetical protein HK104_006265 [Borealophlyctis nickersoniae]